MRAPRTWTLARNSAWPTIEDGPELQFRTRVKVIEVAPLLDLLEGLVALATGSAAQSSDIKPWRIVKAGEAILRANNRLGDSK